MNVRRSITSIFVVSLFPSAALGLTMDKVLVTLALPGGYDFYMGQYEVTNSQYAEFLNAVDQPGENSLALFNEAMSYDSRGGITFDASAPNGSKYIVKSERGNNPVVWVTWYDALRFANWMHNGQGSASTETGAYTLTGGLPTPTNADLIVRNAGARWFLPNHDEWISSAYSGPNNTGSLYPTSSDMVPFSAPPPGTSAPDPANTANFYKAAGGSGYDSGFAVTSSTVSDNNVNYLSDVGAYALAPSLYGTFDQGGNAAEWIESRYGGFNFRGIRGGSFADPASSMLWTQGGSNGGISPDGDSQQWGFRLAAEIPEPDVLRLAAIVGLCGASSKCRASRQTAWHRHRQRRDRKKAP